VGKFATLGIKPALTIFLDLPVKKGLLHRAQTKDRIEQRSLIYHERVRRGYFTLARQEPGRIKIIKLAADKNLTQKNIRALADKLLRE